MCNKKIIMFLFFLLLLLVDFSIARKHTHIQTSAMCYSSSDDNMAAWASSHYDLLINPDQVFLNLAKAEDPTILAIRYMTLSTSRGNDTVLVRQYCDLNGYDDSTYYLWTDTEIQFEGYNASTNSPEPRTTQAGNKIVHYFWTEERNTFDYRNLDIGQFWWYKVKNNIVGSDYCGIMEDEATYWVHRTGDGIYGNMPMFPFLTSWWDTPGASYENLGWTDYNIISEDNMRDINDSLVTLKQDNWLTYYVDSLEAYDLYHFYNGAAYISPPQNIDPYVSDGWTDMYAGSNSKRRGAMIGEESRIRPTYTHGDFTPVMNMIDEFHEAVYDSNCYMINWMDITVEDTVRIGSLRSCVFERLCFYYMFHQPDFSFWMICPSHTGIGYAHPNNFDDVDTLWCWVDAIEYDIGLPDDKYTTVINGTETDNAGQPVYLYKRSFTRGDGQTIDVYWRRYSGSTYGSSSAYVYTTASSYYYVTEAGTLSTNQTDSYTFNNASGNIIVTSSGGGLELEQILTHYGVLNDTANIRVEFFNINGSVSSCKLQLSESTPPTTDIETITDPTNPDTFFVGSENLEPETKYYYRTIAVDGLTTDTSSESSFTTSSNPSLYVTVDNFGTTYDSTNVEITTQYIGDANITKLVLLFDTILPPTTRQDSITSNITNPDSIGVGQLNEWTQYYYRAIAIDDESNYDTSQIGSIRTLNPNELKRSFRRLDE
ncbi:MAG: hypothetical protein GF317_04885 [Candidatus Lokiarchaeota archaeon]|nr:hypothetical protein [Candidatus Lokiarchaeota archaeon]